MLSSHATISPFLWLHNKSRLSHQKTIKGRTIRKVMGGGGETQKNSCKGKCKEEGKEKKFMQKEDPIVPFSESLCFRNQQYYQAQYE